LNKKGQEIGTMMLNIAPCTSNGQLLGEGQYTDDPGTLLNKPFYFKVKK
jgi:hypothetical protein